MCLKKWIDNLLVGLIETYGTNDVFELCNSLEIEIIELEPHNPLLQGNESIYYRDFFNKEVIFIRNNLNYGFKKFIIAHELGHALEHTDVFQSCISKNLINYGKYENQADYFALKLLNISLDEVELYKMTIEQVASTLELPVRALKQLV